MSPLTPEQKLDEARLNLNRTLLAARAGDAKAIENFTGVAEEFLAASQVYNASGAAYLSDFAYVRQLTEEMETLSQNQIDYAESQLQTLKDQVSHLIDIDNSVQSVEDAILALTKAMIEGDGNSKISDDFIRQIATDPNLTQQEKYNIADRLGVSNTQINKATGIPIADLEVGRSRAQANTPTTNSNITDAQIREFVNANSGDLRKVYDAAIQYKVSRFRLAEVMGWNVADIEDWVRKNNLAMFERGTDLVPKTGFALLHKNEAVVPSNAIKVFNRMIEVVQDLIKEQRGQTSDIINSSHQSNIQNAEIINKTFEKVFKEERYLNNRYKIAGIA